MNGEPIKRPKHCKYPLGALYEGAPYHLQNRCTGCSYNRKGLTNRFEMRDHDE